MFKERIIWITGASSGIGESLAYELNRRGSYCIISARRINELERVKSNCRYPENISVVDLDLEDYEDVQKKASEVVKRFGKIDYLFNNGGISQRASVLDTSIEVTRKIFEVNFFGNITLTKAILPSMIENKFGHIVVTSSLSGKFGFFLRSSYSASKHALHGFYETLRLEYAEKNIKVTMVCPDFVNTNMSQTALTGNGTVHGIQDSYQKGGLAPMEFVEKLLKAVSRNKQEIIIGRKGKTAVFLKRLIPGLFTKIISRKKPTG